MRHNQNFPLMSAVALLASGGVWRCQEYQPREGQIMLRTGAYMPKSAMTMSESESLVRYRIFSGLQNKVNILQRIALALLTHLRSRWTMSCSCKYRTPESIDTTTETASDSVNLPF